MPRRLRIEIPGGVYHVTNRGADRADIVKDDEDRHEWFRLFNRVASRYQWQVFAHVLMTNHFHVFLKISDPNLSSGFHDVSSGYATQFNKRHHRTGPLFEGRFHAVLVESEGHAWSLSRYIHLNPCRAGLVKRPEDYRWSTYRHMLDPTKSPPWLAWRTVLSEFGGSETAARTAYCRYVEAGLRDGAPNPLNDAFEDVILGSKSFIDQHKKLVEETDAENVHRTRVVRLDQVLTAVASAFDVSVSNLRQRGRHGNWARDAAIWLSRQVCQIPLRDVATVFGAISTSTVTDSVRRCEDLQGKHPEYQHLCELIRDQLSD